MTQVVLAKSPLWVVGLRPSVPHGLFQSPPSVPGQYRPVLRAAHNMEAASVRASESKMEAATQNDSDLHQLPTHSVFCLCFVILQCRLVQRISQAS